MKMIYPLLRGRYTGRHASYVTYLLLVMGFVSLVFHSVIILAWNTNSDQLTIPSILEDFLHNPTGLDGWQFSRAPYFFPDLFLYGIFKLLFGGLWAPIFLTVLALNFLLFVAGTELLRRLNFNSAGISVLFGLFICLPALAAANVDLAEHVFKYQFSLSTHFSLVVCSMILLVLSISRDEKLISLRSGIVFLVAFLLALSNKIIYIYLLAPWAIALVVLVCFRLVLNRINLLAFGTTCLGLLAAWHVEKYINKQPDMPVSINFEIVFRNLLKILAGISTTGSNSVFISLLFLVVWVTILAGSYLVVKAVIQAKQETKKEAVFSQRIFVCVFLLSGTILNFAALMLVYEEVGSWRYLMAFFYYPIILLSIGLCGYLGDSKRSRFLPLRGHLVFAAVLAAFFLVLIAEGRLERFPGKENMELVRNYETCRSAHGLHSGLAGYWLSRKLNMLSNQDGMVNQLAPWSAKVFYWGNNENWFVRDFFGRPISYDFVIVNDLPLESVRGNFGPPDERVTCGRLNVWTYRDPERLLSRVEAGVYSLLSKRLESGESLSLPLELFSSTAGESDDKGRYFNGGKHQEAYLIYGPYWKMKKGVYKFKINYTYQRDSRKNDVARWEFAYNGGRSILADDSFTRTGENISQDLPLVLDRDLDGFELRVYLKNVPYFAVHSIELTKSR